MGRKKKSNNLKTLGLGALVATIGVYGYLAYINGNIALPKFEQFLKQKNSERVQEHVVTETIEDIAENMQETTKVKIFFITSNNGKDSYRTVYRTNDSGESDIEYAVRCLLAGPTKYEQNKGVYSEIPPTKLISVKEYTNKVVINVSSSFGNGGGADSLYKRTYQLIKTVNNNTQKPTYLLMNGQMVEALGGEGLMLKQPLNGRSLDD